MKDPQCRQAPEYGSEGTDPSATSAFCASTYIKTTSVNHILFFFWCVFGSDSCTTIQTSSQRKMHFKLGLLAAAATLCSAAFRDGCADAPWNSNTDYFLNKFDNDANLPFYPKYNKTYVTIKNRQRRFVVLHCSKEAPPRSVVGEEALIIQVPVKNVAALDGFSQNMIEMLGLSTSIRRTGVYADVTSSCVRGNMMDKITYDDDNWDKAEAVDVTFYGDTKDSDNKKVLVYNIGNYAPLTQLGYIKFFSMFFGLEELGTKLYDEIATSYRCAAANVQEALLSGAYPKGAYVSPIRKEGDKLTVFQSPWWSTILSDAGSRLVNVSADGETTGQGNPTTAQQVSISAITAEGAFAKNSWAIIDTTQYDQLPGKQAPKENPKAVRVTADTYATRSGVSKNIYAVANKNVYLTDKASNRNMRHNFFDRGSARPDLVIRDMIAMLSPTMNPKYTTQFIRPVTKPDDEIALRRYSNTCAVKGKEIETLNLTSCAVPGWVQGFNSSGITPNAYGRADDQQSLATMSTSKGLSGGEKAGIAVGSVVGFLLIAAGVLFGGWKWRRAAAAKKKQQQEMNQVEKGSVTSE
ncbi:periplasmic binding [Cordyceps militaris]|uniref:Periplasmic binding n=1 Tax=Cordyceps militaris TaxID=73501 RepID=A0A2H4SSG4_CORMI|nr:periplasmic binding [Cordyceps militaris]